MDLHSLVVVAPGFAEDLAFIVQLSSKVFAQILQPGLEFFLERI